MANQRFSPSFLWRKKRGYATSAEDKKVPFVKGVFLNSAEDGSSLNSAEDGSSSYYRLVPKLRTPLPRVVPFFGATNVAYPLFQTRQ
jgi:hypothetical protein